MFVSMWAYSFTPLTHKSRVIGSHEYQLFEEFPGCFPKQLHHLKIILYEGSDFSTSSPTLTFYDFYYNNPSGFESVPHWSFYLNLPNG